MGISLNQMTNAVKKSKEYIDTNTLDLSSANFVSENGFGGLRIQDGKYQYYNKNTSSWVDVQYTDDNAYIGNLIPNPVTVLCAELDESTHNVKIKLTEPEDTKVNDSTTYSILGIKVVMKRGSEPETVDDGDLLLDLTRKKFGMYMSEWYTNTDISVMDTDTYYCKAFSYNEFGIYNNNGTVSSFSYTAPEVYGFTLDQSESDSDSMITYFGNNELYTPASTTFTGKLGVFNCGDWGNAFFFKGCKPCMLKYDGTVDYYLNPNDYTKKENGEDSDIADSSYEGNVMVEFPKVYLKYEVISEDKMNVYISNTKIDDDYHCFAHIDSNGNEIDYIYVSAYNGKVINGKLRSISGVSADQSKTIQYFIDSAKANNPDDLNDIWNIDVFADRQLINVLLILISKTIDSALAFGYGFSNYYNRAKLGVHNTNGIFYGSRYLDDTQIPNKVFGIENYWGNLNRFVVGLVKDSNNIQKVKMYKTDGESNDYNLTGEGYHEIGELPVLSNVYMDKQYFSEYCMIPKSAYGSISTYYKSLVSSVDGESVAILGFNAIASNNRFNCKMLGVSYVKSTASSADIGTGLSCKPLAKTTE